MRPSRRHVIADIGSGTGFLSELFLKNGNRVYGIEPNKDMRQAGEDYLASYDAFSSIEGSAEATTLMSQRGFHHRRTILPLFEPDAARGEFRRIIKPGGWMVIA